MNEKFVELVTALHRKGTDLNDREYIKAIAFAYFRAAYMQALRFKHNKWSHEREWRAVAIDKREKFKTYQNAGRSVRYLPVDLDLGKNISEVILGKNFGSEEQLQKAIPSLGGVSISRRPNS